MFVEETYSASLCKPHDYGNGSPVCVCDADYCDFVESVEPFGKDEAVIYLSDKSGRRLERSTVRINSAKSGKLLFTLGNTHCK